MKLGNEKSLVAFCQGIQKGAPVDSFVTPELGTCQVMTAR